MFGMIGELQEIDLNYKTRASCEMPYEGKYPERRGLFNARPVWLCHGML